MATLGGAAAAAPQPPAAASTQPATFSTMPTAPSAVDSFLALVDVRSTADLQKELELVMARVAAAEARIERGRMMQARAQTHRKLKENEIRSLQDRRDLADKSKNELEKKDLENQKKLAELQKQMLERREELRAREIDDAKADLEWGASLRRALELELDLASRREQHALLFGRPMSEAVGAEAQRLEKQIGELEKKTLEAQIEESSKRKQSAERRIELAKIRKKLFDAQRKVAAGA
jgi:predicted ribosome quality control (RQC) complex YloA/Tae2 family protein